MSEVGRSLLAKKLLDAANKSDGFKAWSLAPIAAEYIQELEARRDELLEALKNLLKVYEGEGGTQYHAGDMARAAIAKATGVLAEGDSEGSQSYP